MSTPAQTPSAKPKPRPTPLARTRTKTQSERLAESWLESFNPLRHLSIDHAQAIFDAARRGNDVRLQWIYANIEAVDPTLMICAERRAGALIDLDFTVKPKPATRAARYDATLAKEQTAFLEAVYGAAEERGLWSAVEHLATAFFRGHAHVAPRWSFDGTSLEGFENLDAWNVCRDLVTGQWHWNPSASETLNFDSLEVIPPGELVTLVRSRHVDYPAMSIYIRNALGEKAWGRFLERYGVPPVIITMPPDMDPSRVSEYCAAAEKVADGGTGALPHGSQVTYATEARGTNPFHEFLAHQQELIVLMATGGTLTSLTGATGIGQGATGAHEESWRAIVRRDAGFIAAAINRTLTDTLLDRAFPGKPHLARFDFETEAAPTPAEIFDLAGKAVAAGYKVDKAELEERTGYRLIEQTQPMEGGLPPFGGNFLNASASPAAVGRGHETAKVEKAIRALARSLQLDFGPIAEALQLFLESPSATEAQRLIERLPDLLPGDPQAAIILEQTLAEAYAETVKGSATIENGDCRARDPSKCRVHGNHPGEGQKEREKKGDKDEFGTTETEKLLASPKKSVERIKSVMTHLMRQKAGFESKAAYREDTGWIGIDYGYPGNENNDYKGGHGLSHILTKHKEVTIESLSETLQQGECYKHHLSEKKLYLIHGNHVAVVSKHRTGRLLITDYEDVTEKELETYKARGRYHVKGKN